MPHILRILGNGYVQRQAEGGAARVGLNDDSELRLSSVAEVTIDSYVYDPEATPGGAATRIFTA